MKENNMQLGATDNMSAVAHRRFMDNLTTMVVKWKKKIIPIKDLKSLSAEKCLFVLYWDIDEWAMKNSYKWVCDEHKQVFKFYKKIKLFNREFVLPI